MGRCSLFQPTELLQVAFVSFRSLHRQVSLDGNVTTSVLKLRPTMQDHDQMLSCRAENPVLTNSVKDDSVRLEVYCERLPNCQEK